MYSKKTLTIQNIVLIFLDFIAIIISLFISVFIRFKVEESVYLNFKDVYGLLLIFILSYLLQFVIFNFNKSFRTNSFLAEMFTSVKINIFIALSATFLMYFLRTISLNFSRGVFFIFVVVNCILVFSLHRFYLILLKRQLSKGFNRRQLLIVTNMTNVDSLISKINAVDYLEYNICAISLLDYEIYSDMLGKYDIPVISADTDLVQHCISHVVDEVFIFLPDYQLGSIHNEIRKIISMGITIHINVDIFSLDLAAKKTVTPIGNTFAVTFANNFLSFRQRFFKRLLDIIGGIIGCAITILLTIIFAPIIFIESPGPIFFRQKRVGRNGRFFHLYKFRSMRPDADDLKEELMEQNQVDGLMFKIDKDPRITKIGSFMRKTSLDEFPQFFNVLKGDMSLVGTRPPTLDEYEQYKSHHKKRLCGKPGITGLWQISGRSNILDFEEVVKLDVNYLNNYSFFLDIKILIKTLFIVIKRDGAK